MIIAVGKIASEQLDFIYVSGCAAIGWIAAIAQWLFDMRVTVFSFPDDADVVYSNCNEN